AGLSASVALAAVTLWTGIVFWRRGRTGDSHGATLLTWTFVLWGLHHLDYPLLRPLGTGVLYGVFADVVFIVAATVGTLVLVLGDGRRALEARSHQLEQLTRLLLRAQEDERRRIARELHDEAGQILTAVKIELDLEGGQEALTNVARHASARRVQVRIESAQDRVRLAVEDDGRGVSGEPTPHLGLLGIRERITTLGGTLVIEGAPGQGFRIQAEIPAGA